MQQCHSGVEGRSVEVLLVYRSLRLLRILQYIVMSTVGNTVLYNAAVSQWRSVLEYWSTWVVVLLVHRSLKDTPSTTVLRSVIGDTEMSTVRRRQYPHNRSTSKTHHECWLIEQINQHSNNHQEQLTNKESKVCLVGRGRRGEGAEEWSIQCGVTASGGVHKTTNELMWYFAQKFTGRVLRRAIPWLHKFAFSKPVETYSMHWYWLWKNKSVYMTYSTYNTFLRKIYSVVSCSLYEQIRSTCSTERRSTDRSRMRKNGVKRADTWHHLSYE